MQLNNLPKLKSRSKKRLGRGIGSGKGKTAGRGTKGQKARGKVSSDFSGGGAPLYKKIPFLRGSRNRKVSPESLVINLSMLSTLKKNTEVTIETLISQNLIKETDAKKYGVKILNKRSFSTNKGDINIPLIIKLPISKKAAEKIIKAGGKVE